MLPETPQQRRDRVTAEQVKAKWPEPLDPNVFVNTILDIIRSAGMNVASSEEPWHPMDVLEAIDVLSWMHLDASMKWSKMGELVSEIDELRYKLEELRDLVSDLDTAAYNRHSSLRRICDAMELPTTVLGDDADNGDILCAEIRRLRVLAGNPHPLDYDALSRSRSEVKRLSDHNHAIVAKLSGLMSPDDFHNFMTSLDPMPKPLTDEEHEAFTEFMRTR